MPTFGAGPGKVAEPSAASSGGWGSGAAERPSLDSEEVLLREEHEVPENISQEQPQFATAPHAVVSDSPFDRPNGAPQVVNQATERRSQPPLQSRKNSWPQPDEQARSYERPEGPQGQTPQRSRQGRQIFGSSLNSGLGGTPPTPSQRHSNPTSAPLGGHDQSQWVRRYPLGTRSPPHEISESVTASGSNIGKARQSKPASTYGWNLRPDDESQQHESLNGQLSEIHQPVPPHRAEHAPPKRQTSYDDSGYQATILDPQDYQQPQAPFDDSHAVDWQHLRRRNSEPAPPAPQPQQQPRQDQQPWDDAAIDRIFLQHQQQRQQYQPGDYARPTPQQPAHAPMPLRPGERRCGRCGELGHVARECEGPIRSKCNVCGEAGHHARTCPRVTSNASGEPTIRRPFVSRDASAHRFVERTAARSGASWGAQLVERSTAHGDAASNAKNVESPTGSDFNRQHERMRDVQTVPKRDSAAAFVGERQADAVTDSQERTYSVPEPRKTKDEAVEDEEQPAERVFRSRKFADDAPRREKSVRRSRRDEDDDEDDESGAMREERNLRKAARKAEKAQMAAAKEAEKKAIKARKAEQGTPVNLPEFVSVATLAQLLGVRYESFVSRLERLGYDDLFPGKVLNSELSGMVAMEYNFEPIFESAADEAEDRDLKARPVVEDKEFLPTRPPVVTIMGHVDHGKTTILDYLRKSSVAAGEAGGITQHIGAFSVPLASSGRTITFLDTPGHAAFLAMRQRGANVTDIVILVVAADDSVKPQTLEAIKHAKAAGVPMIVAVNKVDKAEADVQRVKQDLARHGVEIEDFGGDTQVVCVSGKTGEGMDELEEAAVTLSEILDHRAETDGPVEGWVLEATTKKAGRVATVLVRRGTLKFGAVIVAGKSWARVRTLRNEAGVVVPEVGPGMPVEVDGWRDQPAAGDEVLQAPNEQKASDAVQFRQEKEEREKTATDMEAINESRRVEQEKREKEKMAARAARRGRAVDGMDYFEAAAQVEEEDVEEDTPTGRIEVPFIIKADVSGSAEAVAAYILGVSSPLIGPRILRSTVGGLNESDVELADTARGHIIAFNLPTDEGMKGEAEARGVKVLENNIIYRVLDDVKAVLEERLPPLVTHKVTGEAEISAAFEIGIGGRRTMNIAGCKVRNGTVTRGARVRVLRGDQKIFDGTFGLFITILLASC